MPSERHPDLGREWPSECPGRGQSLAQRPYAPLFEEPDEPRQYLGRRQRVPEGRGPAAYRDAEASDYRVQVVALD
jgi:hypothetical protein